MMTRAEANVLALMAAAGIPREESASRLDLVVAVTHGDHPAERRLAAQVMEVLGRTLGVVPGGQADIRLHVGSAAGAGNPQPDLSVDVGRRAVAVRTRTAGECATLLPGEPLSPLLSRIAACYVAGRVISFANPSDRFAAMPDVFVIDADALGITPEVAAARIAFDDDVLVGAGGVANGFLWALQDLPVSGRLHVVDPKAVSDSNGNRCVFFDGSDVGLPKVQVLHREVRIPGLELIPVEGDFASLRRRLGRVRRVFTTVDSRGARRSVRNELPLQVLDASTTDLSEVVVFSELQPTPDACLCCVYHHVRDEEQHERHVAEALGIDVEDVRRRNIDGRVAGILAARHAGLRVEDLVGTSLDTLFRQLCGEGVLVIPGGKQALAPLGFISNLAGSLLCLELARRSTGVATNLNYAALDPWRPPFQRARIRKRRREDCAFCAGGGIAALAELWPDDVLRGQENH